MPELAASTSEATGVHHKTAENRDIKYVNYLNKIFSAVPTPRFVSRFHFLTQIIIYSSFQHEASIKIWVPAFAQSRTDR